MPPGLVILLLSLLLGLQPITTDLYLPALPALTAGFGAPMAQAQLTLSALLLAFGLSQLVWGPLSDRFGRRPILLIGMSAYVLASIASTLAPSMEMLIVWRTVQGAAMGAGVMCARAIVRDLYTPLQGARVMSKGLSGRRFLVPSAWRCWPGAIPRPWHTRTGRHCNRPPWGAPGWRLCATRLLWRTRRCQRPRMAACSRFWRPLLLPLSRCWAGAPPSKVC
jgi:MFS family permease